MVPAGLTPRLPAQALMDNTELDARAIVEKALAIAAEICIYTNRNVTIEELPAGGSKK